MTFSLRLTADLTYALAAPAIGSRRGLFPIQQISPESDFRAAASSRSPILWVAGSEPLEYPEVARLTNSLAASERSVFLETSGVSLKRRLHEFQPSSRFYFAVRFDNFETAVEESNGRDGALRAGIEAIRMARLAGFFACAHLVARPGDAVHPLQDLHGKISEWGVDGFLITCAARSPELEKTVGQLRRRLLSWRWALLSGLVESVSMPAALRDTIQNDRQPISESRPDSLGESAEAG